MIDCGLHFDSASCQCKRTKRNHYIYLELQRLLNSNRIMQTENSVLASNTSAVDTVADLGPLGMPLTQQRGTGFFMTGSLRSYSDNEMRTSMFNGRAVSQSPMFDAGECLLRSTARDSLPKENVIISAETQLSPLHYDEKEDSSPLKDFQQHSKHKTETTKVQKEVVGHKRHRIGASFMERNQNQIVPRFAPNELEIGDQIGSGQYGTVFEIDSLTRESMSDFDDAKMIPQDSDRMQTMMSARTNFAMTLPVLTDLTMGPANLNNFLKRRVATCENLFVLAENDTMAESDRSLISPELENGEKSLELNELHAHRRPALKVSDEKGQMINRQQQAEDIRTSFNGYAVKVVRGDIQTERKRRVAAADMAAEANLLSALSHRNIIQVRGIMGYVEKPGDYGIIMDKLQCTLHDQIIEWAKITPEANVTTLPSKRHNLPKNTPDWIMRAKNKMKRPFRQTEFFWERMQAVSDVSQALMYLHQKRIVYRDLKPENVGLIKTRHVLFDFGLSRELKESDKAGFGKDQYHATGLTGSRLFMAPEVATNKPYGFSADVYSFAILFWEVVSLQEVFPGMTMNKHHKSVVLKGQRPPSLEDVLPPELNKMMEASWDANPSNRPPFDDICQILTLELNKHENDSSTPLSSLFHFSTFTDFWHDERSEQMDEPKNTKSRGVFKKHLHLNKLDQSWKQLQQRFKTNLRTTRDPQKRNKFLKLLARNKQ